MNNAQHNRRDDNRPAGQLSWSEPAPAVTGLVDAMIDIESLGTTPGSAILSIGAVMFGLAGLGETFYAPVLLQSCTAVGLTIDPNTIAWWMQQSDATRAAAFRDDAEALAVVLYRFTTWFAEVGAERPWCHGATFDVPLLEAAYKACGMVPPWKFWNVRDTRTLYDLGGVKVDRSQGIHHNALDDARAQAEAAVAALWRLQNGRGTNAADVPHHFACPQKGYNPLCAGCEAERAAAPAPMRHTPAGLLNAEELAALRRFDECAQDGEGYDVPKEMMQRLAEIGAVRRTSASYYEITDFGMHVLGAATVPAPVIGCGGTGKSVGDMPCLGCDACPREVAPAPAAQADQDAMDAARLDFMVQHEAWVAFGKDGESCRVFSRNEDGAAVPMLGWGARHWRHDPREAIDAAMSQAKGAGKEGAA